MEAPRREDSVKQVSDLISDTFLISGCPVEKVDVLHQLDTFLTFCKNTELKKELARTGQSQLDFGARALAEGVEATINKEGE